MRQLVVVLALAFAPAATAGLGKIDYPPAKFVPVEDATGGGYVSWLIDLRGKQSAFCWMDMSVVTKARPLFIYLRRGPHGRVVGTIDVRPHDPFPWYGGQFYSGCMVRRRALILDLHAHPRRYYLDVRTRTHRHAIRARLHGPPVR